MKKRLALLGSAILVLAVTFGFGLRQEVSATVPGTNTLVSVNDTGNGQGGDGNVNPSYLWTDSQISANGNFIAFQSAATNLVSGDTNGYDDIFVRNLLAGATTRVDVSSSGVQANSRADSDVNPGQVVALSRTGRYVAFVSLATNLIDGQTTPSDRDEVYIHDTQTGTTSLVSETSDGIIANYTADQVFGVSSDGRFVLFASQATNLGPSVSNSGWHLYMADRQSGTFQALNSTSLNSYAPEVLSASMSCDGSIVADTEFQAALTSDDTNTNDNVYLLDLRDGLTIKNLTGSAVSGQASVSCNGDYIASQTGNHAYVFNRVDNTTSQADVSSGGISGNNDPTGIPSVDDNGDTVFTSSATNLVTGTSPANEAYFHNYLTGTTEMLSRNLSGTAGNNTTGIGAMAPALSADGSVAAYDSPSTNLISSDTNGKVDVFTSLTGL